MNVLWVVGEPGVGKTTLSRLLLRPLALYPKPKWTRGVDGCVAAGHYTNSMFDGADTVPYNGVEAALEFWLDNYTSYSTTIFDGDRFSYRGVVEFFEKRAPEHQLVCARLVGPDEARSRRDKRGSKQNATWLKGRATKSRKFFDQFRGKKILLDASRAALDTLATLKAFLEHP